MEFKKYLETNIPFLSIAIKMEINASISSGGNSGIIAIAYYSTNDTTARAKYDWYSQSVSSGYSTVNGA
jgi:hypothetical protein